jgi:UDP-N-acetylmuramate dehydrogenase
MEAHSEQDLMDLSDALQQEPVPILVLGRGSNVVISDAGFEGVVVRLGTGMAWLEIGPGGGVAAGAGLSQPALARGTAAAGRGGLEFMVGIPGSVGGAVRMNSGGHGGSYTAEWLVAARVVDLAGGKATSRDPGMLEMGYRHSNLGVTEVVVSAEFRTVERPRDECEAILREITKWRKEQQPGGTFNAGSVFKNPVGDSAGRIIDDLGLKGLAVGGASVSQRHANFIVAEPGTAAQEIFDLIILVQGRVHERTGVALEPEIRLVGDFGEGS